MEGIHRTKMFSIINDLKVSVDAPDYYLFNKNDYFKLTYLEGIKNGKTKIGIYNSEGKLINTFVVASKCRHVHQRMAGDTILLSYTSSTSTVHIYLLNIVTGKQDDVSHVAGNFCLTEDSFYYTHLEDLDNITCFKHGADEITKISIDKIKEKYNPYQKEIIPYLDTILIGIYDDHEIVDELVLNLYDLEGNLVISEIPLHDYFNPWDYYNPVPFFNKDGSFYSSCGRGSAIEHGNVLEGFSGDTTDVNEILVDNGHNACDYNKIIFCSKDEKYTVMWVRVSSYECDYNTFILLSSGSSSAKSARKVTR